MMKRCMFQGLANFKQIDKIFEVLGWPENSEEELSFIKDKHSMDYVQRLPKTKGTLNLEERVPNLNPLAKDLLLKMLRLNPNERITAKDAIRHPYFNMFPHLVPPESETKYQWDWENQKFTPQLLQKLIYLESLTFHPP